VDIRFQVFRDHVGIRQNIVAWAENVEWNKSYWEKETLLPGISISKTVTDAFLNQEKYAIGCDQNRSAAQSGYCHQINSLL